MMLGWAPNLFALMSAANAQGSATQVQQPTPLGSLCDCPKTTDIKSRAYTDPSLPAPYGEGYQYSASGKGHIWTGQTAGTADDYLAPEYDLKAQAFSERDGKVYCDYGGRRLVKNAEVSDPYLRLSTPK